MDMIYFGPSSSFLRLDSETVLHILAHTIKHSLPISRAILAWDIITGKLFRNLWLFLATKSYEYRDMLNHKSTKFCKLHKYI